jgi:hypothetical protein
MTDAELADLLRKAATALDEEAAFVIDVGVDAYGRSKPSIPERDRPYFDAVCEQAQGLRELIAMIEARGRTG